MVVRVVVPLPRRLQQVLPRWVVETEEMPLPTLVALIPIWTRNLPWHFVLVWKKNVLDSNVQQQLLLPPLLKVQRKESRMPK